MISALLRAFADLRTPALRRFVMLGFALSLMIFIVVWIAVGFVLGRTTLFGWRPLEWLTDLLGVLAVLVLSWLMFPAVVTMVIGLFLDRIAAAVEGLHYPGLSPARSAPIAETAITTARLMGLTLLLNLFALPIYVMAPVINLFVFLGLNGYLLGREYFEVVALRRLDPTATRAARRRSAWRVFFGGAIIAGLFAIPLVNLAAPVIATAFMVHFFEGLRRGDPQLAAS
jgi:CysZ protein